jgi:hypothetical protein
LVANSPKFTADVHENRTSFPWKPSQYFLKNERTTCCQHQARFCTQLSVAIPSPNV